MTGTKKLYLPDKNKTKQKNFSRIIKPDTELGAEKGV